MTRHHITWGEGFFVTTGKAGTSVSLTTGTGGGTGGGTSSHPWKVTIGEESESDPELQTINIASGRIMESLISVVGQVLTSEDGVDASAGDTICIEITYGEGEESDTYELIAVSTSGFTSFDEEEDDVTKVRYPIANLVLADEEDEESITVNQIARNNLGVAYICDDRALRSLAPL